MWASISHSLLDVYSAQGLRILCVKISVFIKIKFGKSVTVFLHIPFSAPFSLFPLLLVFQLHILNFTVRCYVTGLWGSAHFFPQSFFTLCIFQPWILFIDLFSSLCTLASVIFIWLSPSSQFFFNSEVSIFQFWSFHSVFKSFLFFHWDFLFLWWECHASKACFVLLLWGWLY